MIVPAQESNESILKQCIKLFEITCSHSLLAIKKALQSMHNCNYNILCASNKSETKDSEINIRVSFS